MILSDGIAVVFRCTLGVYLVVVVEAVGELDGLVLLSPWSLWRSLWRPLWSASVYDEWSFSLLLLANKSTDSRIVSQKLAAPTAAIAVCLGA